MSGHRMDKTEFLRTLQQNGKPTKLMAHELGTTEFGFLQKRRRLVKSGVIKHAFILNPDRLGFKTLGFFTIKCSDADVGASVAKALCDYPQVQEVHVLGKQQLLAKVRTRSKKDLEQWERGVKQQEGVQSVQHYAVTRTERESHHLAI